VGGVAWVGGGGVGGGVRARDAFGN